MGDSIISGSKLAHLPHLPCVPLIALGLQLGDAGEDVLTHLSQTFAPPVVLRFPPLEETALAVLVHILLLLGGVELLRGDLLRPTFVGDDALLHLLRCSALAREKRVWGDKGQVMQEQEQEYSPILNACHEPTTPLWRVSTTWKTSDFLKLISPLSVWS